MEKAIFWDFDGTLVYSNQSFLTSLEAAARGCGISLEEDRCREFLSRACSWNHPERSYELRRGELWWQDLLDQTCDFLRREGVSRGICPAICESFRENAVSYPYRLYEDAGEILAWTQEKGWKNYLLSNNFPELRQRVEELGLSPFFTGLFLSSELGYEKPRPEIFTLAARAAGEPEILYMIGDNPAADIAGAAGAGFHTVLVHNKRECPQAEAVCRELRELKNIL